MRFFLAFAGMSLALAGSALAQTAPVTPLDPSTHCEVHFWGSNVASTSNYSGKDNMYGLAGELLAGPSPQSSQGLSSDLSREAQAEALKRLDLSRLLKMSDSYLVVEPGQLEGKPNRKGPRLTSSRAPCYAELIVDYIGYTSHITAGRKFGARYYLRRYAGPDGSAQIQNGGKEVKLKIYPAKHPQDQAAAILELRTAFAKATEGFLIDKIQ